MLTIANRLKIIVVHKTDKIRTIAVNGGGNEFYEG